MKLVFEQTPNRHRCGCESFVNGLPMQCSFSSSKTVTIPADVSFNEGVFARQAGAAATTMTVCPNHEMRLRRAFEEFAKTPAEP